MRVAYVCADAGIPVFGRKGCSIHVQEVLRALLDVGAEIDLFTPRGEGAAPAGLKAVRVHGLPFTRLGAAAIREKAALARNDHLRAALEYEGPFDLVYERYSLWSHAGMEYGRATETPGLLEVNAPLIEEQQTFRDLVNREAAEQVASRVFEAAGVLVAVSHGVASYLGRRGVDPNRVQVIPNGVNPERFPLGLKASRPRPARGCTVGFVGSLKPWHGLSTLVEAFELVRAEDRDARMILIGDGPERSRLTEELARLGLQEAVDFTGSVEASAVPGLLASMDIGVAPYARLPDFYFSPLKVFEYMAAGLPVVASRIGQLEEVIHHEVDGLLCPPDNPMALAQELTRLCKEPDLRIRLGSAARKKVLRNHTWKDVARRILALAGLEYRRDRTLEGRCLLTN